MKRTRITTTILMLFMVFALWACGDNIPSKGGADRQVAEQTEQMMQEANRQVGLPGITNYKEKKDLKKIYELRDDAKMITYTYIVNLYGKLIFLGKSIGYGIPYSTQFSNPQRVYHEAYSGSNGSAYGATFITQPEPNGLFMPEGLSATWVMLIDPNTNKPTVVYVEPEILVSPFPMHKIKPVKKQSMKVK